jgi:adenine-specific DNA methylase
MAEDKPRLIEVAFPLKQASLDSVHEKNVRHGHISTLHIWPARRPLAACRAALIATLLPDPGNEAERKKLLEKLGGIVRTKDTFQSVGGRKVRVLKEDTEGGILHWGRENGPDLEFFREEIKKAYGGRAPRVLDPFAGGGAIPLEAMRLRCEVTAIDINAVAWFILKCTLEYPQRLAGQTRPLPSFALTLNPSPKGREKKRVKANSLPLWHDGHPGVPPVLLARARELRKAQTSAEDLLWECLRDGRLNRTKFRRQHVIGPYIADFYCHEARLVVEAEGDVHEHRKEKDEVRQRYLEALGYRVLRFSNERVLGDTEAVLQEIEGALTLPSPSGRGFGVRAEASLADHVRAWGHWVLERARKDLEVFYPTIGGKPTVAYLWARTVTCKNCRATLPLLKTLWLCRKDNKRYRLDIKKRPDRSGVDFEVVAEPVVGGNAAQRRAHDQRVGQGTMSRSGAWCPVCGSPNTVAMTLGDIRAEGMAGRLGAQMTAVVVNNPSPRGRGQGEGKEYHPPTPEELTAAQAASAHIDEVFKDIPFGLPTEPTPTGGGSGAGRAFSVQNYGMTTWASLFTPRQLVALGTFVKHTRAAREAMRAEGYPPEWVEALSAYSALSFDRLTSFASANVRWKLDAEAVVDVFARFALPVLWDFAEAIPIGDNAGAYSLCFERICTALDTLLAARLQGTAKAHPISATCEKSELGTLDLVVTDPPYYDAIPYSDAMDYFYIWLRRTLYGLSPEIDRAFQNTLGPKWDSDKNDGELIDDSSRFGGDAQKSKAAYEEGMFRAFRVCHESLMPEGRMVVVFANKQPDAWEKLVSAMIRAGFVVHASWPIQTEMGNRTRALASAALSSSVWLVCRKRPETARPGWDNQVLEEMRSRIYDRLRTFWDAGIRGPDFVWAATGPAMEAYSKHPVVKKADEPNAVLTVSEFLHHVRRIVVDYVVGRVLSRNGESTEASASGGLDNLTIYYLLHRHDFGLEEAPVGACILYAQSCSLHDRDLADRYDLLAYSKGKAAGEAEENEEAEEEEESATSGSTVKLKRWEQRRHKDLGMPASGRPASLIDQIHHIMRLWKAGDVQKVDSYLEDQGLRRNPLFARVLQALIELARKDNQPDEVSLLESIMNHITARGMHPQMRLMTTEE